LMKTIFVIRSSLVAQLVVISLSLKVHLHPDKVSHYLTAHKGHLRHPDWTVSQVSVVFHHFKVLAILKLGHHQEAYKDHLDSLLEDLEVSRPAAKEELLHPHRQVAPMPTSRS
jgi:hypothetical protein